MLLAALALIVNGGCLYLLDLLIVVDYYWNHLASSQQQQNWKEGCIDLKAEQAIILW